VSPCPAPFGFNGCNPDFLNVDLTMTRKFDPWEFGVVAFGSTDLTSPLAGYARQSQIAVGGLIGRSFGGLILQAYLTTDVYEKNYGGHDTRLWGRVILPLWTAPHYADDHAGVLQKRMRPFFNRGISFGAGGAVSSSSPLAAVDLTRQLALSVPINPQLPHV
jgi:hypothetical protein